YWWRERGSYLLFILRELSSVFVAWAVIYLLLLISAVARGESRYRGFLDLSAGPGGWLLYLVALAVLAFHAVSWVYLASQAMVGHAGGKRVPGKWIAISNYALWAVVSVVVAWIILGG